MKNSEEMKSKIKATNSNNFVEDNTSKLNNFNLLPRDIQKDIFQSLDKNQNIVRLVCKEWCKIIPNPKEKILAEYEQKIKDEFPYIYEDLIKRCEYIAESTKYNNDVDKITDKIDWRQKYKNAFNTGYITRKRRPLTKREIEAFQIMKKGDCTEIKKIT